MINVTDAIIVGIVLIMVAFAILRSVTKKKSEGKGHCAKCSFKDSCQKYKSKK